MGSTAVLAKLSDTTPIRMNWKLFSICLLCTIYGVRATSLVVKREAKCDEIHQEFTLCTKRAYADYTNNVKKGPDGKPDFLARKACNYMTAVVMECDKILAPCWTEEELTEKKDEQLEQVLEQVQSSIKEWDTNKCPATGETGDALTLTSSVPFALILATLF